MLLYSIQKISRWRKLEKCVKGLPESKGTIITIIASNPSNGGEFYALNKSILIYINNSIVHIR